jgi:hypothetical protein
LPAPAERSAHNRHLPETTAQAEAGENSQPLQPVTRIKPTIRHVTEIVPQHIIPKLKPTTPRLFAGPDPDEGFRSP